MKEKNVKYERKLADVSAFDEAILFAELLVPVFL